MTTRTPATRPESWRYPYDRFGWTTRSSELHESRLLRIGSPLFHFGLLVVIVGHVIGLLIPKSWTDALGLSQQAYHVQALVLGTVAGVCTLGGVAILIYRRRTTGPVFAATTRNDKLMYVVSRCSRSGRSPGSCTPSRPRWATSSAPTSSTVRAPAGRRTGRPGADGSDPS